MPTSPPSTSKPAEPRKKPFKPSKQTMAVRPHKYKNPTKAEMYEDLRKAVENTK